jgi:cyclomaltodextrinase
MRRLFLLAGTLTLLGCQVMPTTAADAARLQAQGRSKGHVSVPEWAKDAVFYQIFPERFANGDKRNDPPKTQAWGGKPENENYFGGDLQGVLDKLPYLKDLGVNTLYFNPVFAASSNHKYNTRDYRTIDPHFGDNALFKKLVAAAHAQGLKIVLDGVFNHTGDDHYAFQDAERNGSKSQYWSWYGFGGFPVVKSPKPNYNAWWGFHTLPQLRAKDNPEVQKYLLDTVADWTKTGIDGWRLDVPNEIDSDSFWQRFRTTVKGINPNAYIVGEIWTDGRRWLQGDQFDAVTNYLFREQMIGYFGKGSLNTDQVDANLAGIRNMYHAETTSVMFNMLSSHDVPRFLSEAGGDEGSVKLATIFQMTYLGAPVVYYGDEVGMAGAKDPDNRRCFPWDGKQNKQHRDLTKQLISWRKAFPSLRRGDFQTIMRHNDHGMWAYQRTAGADKTAVLLNLGRQDRATSLDLGKAGWADGKVTDVFSNRTFTIAAGQLKLDGIPARGAMMFRTASKK